MSAKNGLDAKVYGLAEMTEPCRRLLMAFCPRCRAAQGYWCFGKRHHVDAQHEERYSVAGFATRHRQDEDD